jgi:hypothetical protein
MGFCFFVSELCDHTIGALETSSACMTTSSEL